MEYRKQKSPELMECFNKFFAFHVFCVIDHHERPIDLRIKTHSAYINRLVRPDVFVPFFRSGKRKVIFIKGDFPPCNFYGKSICRPNRFHHHHGGDLPSGMFDHVGGQFRDPSLTACFKGRTGRKEKGGEKKKRNKNFCRYKEGENGFFKMDSCCFFLHKFFLLPLFCCGTCSSSSP